MKAIVNETLVELLLDNLPYEELVGYYEYTDEDIAAAHYYINHTAPDDLIELMEAFKAQREEEEALWEEWAACCW